MIDCRGKSPIGLIDRNCDVLAFLAVLGTAHAALLARADALGHILVAVQLISVLVCLRIS